MTKKDLSKFECSKHGGEGDPNCPECWDMLGELLNDEGGVHLVTDAGDVTFPKK